MSQYVMYAVLKKQAFIQNILFYMQVLYLKNLR